MSRAYLLILAFTLVAAELAAQGNFAPQQNVGIVYNSERTFNFRVATNRSFTVGMEFGRLRTYNKTKTWYANIGELKHVKEQRQSADRGPAALSDHMCMANKTAFSPCAQAGAPNGIIRKKPNKKG